MNNRLRNILVALVFSIFLILPVIQFVTNAFPVFDVDENRKMSELPSFSLSEYSEYPDDFNDYYTDNFILRNQFLVFNSYFKSNALNSAPINTKAIIGKDGWMFSLDNLKKVHFAKDVLNDKQLNRFYNIFKYREKFLDSIGCVYYVVIAPVKSTIYPDKIPSYYGKPADTTLTDQVIDLLDTVAGIRLIDLREPLKVGKKYIRTYHKTDTHWNYYGSFIAYNEIAKSLSNDFSMIKPMKRDDYIFDSIVEDGMNLKRSLGLYHDVNEVSVTFKPKFEVAAKKGSSRNYPSPKFSLSYEYERVYTTSNDSLPKLLMIRDSFARTVLPFLNEHFSESVYIFDNWHHEFNQDIVLKEKPDVFIQLILESQLKYMYNNSKKP